MSEHSTALIEQRLPAPPGIKARWLHAAVPGVSKGAVVVAGASSTPAHAAVSALFVPGRWQTGMLWNHDDVGQDFRTALAAAGVPSVSVRYRTSSLQGPDHHQALADCGTAELITDIDEAARIVAERFSSAAVVVIGYSLGAMLACLAMPLLRQRIPVAGIVLLDGGFGPVGTKRDHPLLVANPARERRFVSLARSLLAERTLPPQRLARLGAGITSASELRFLLCADRWWPGRQLADMEKVLAERRYQGQPLDRILTGLRLPVLAIAATARESRAQHRAATTAALIGGAGSQVIWLDGWSHAHVLAHPQARRAVQPRLIAWTRWAARRAGHPLLSISPSKQEACG